MFDYIDCGYSELDISFILDMFYNEEIYIEFPNIKYKCVNNVIKFENPDGTWSNSLYKSRVLFQRMFRPNEQFRIVLKDGRSSVRYV